MVCVLTKTFIVSVTLQYYLSFCLNARVHVMTWQTPQHPPCLPTTGSNGQSTFDERKEEQRKDSLLLNQMQNWMLISSQDIYFVEVEPISPHMFGLEMTRLPPIMVLCHNRKRGEHRRSGRACGTCWCCLLLGIIAVAK